MTKYSNELVERYVRVFFEEISMKTDLEGYKALMVAMNLYFVQGFRFKWLYELYEEIGKVCSGDVEKNIRIAIESAFTNGDPDTLYQLYGDMIPKGKDKPMAQYFIPRTIHILCSRMEQDQVSG